ncbi:MAG: acetyl-CoA hydrolase/transferase family protein [Bacteroidota bacterium]
MYTPVTAEEAVKVIKSGDRIFIHSVACAPHHLINAMVGRADELHRCEVVHLHTEGGAPYTRPEYKESFELHSFFVGHNAREATQAGRADYIPVFLSEVPRLIRKNIVPIDVALVQVSVPDKHGYCSLGGSVDATLAAVQSANIVIAQVNKNMPRALGDALIPISNLDYFVEHDSPIIEATFPEPDAAEMQIGRNIAELVEDGATLQMGIGAIPNAVLASLTSHKRLGVHTEMFSDGLLPLIESGVVTNEEKVLDPHKIVAAFVMGTKKLYDFLDDNTCVSMMDVAYVNDVANIRRNPKVTAINSAIEIDLTGQVCADSIGTKHFSGVGGQIDFIRGASYSEGGKPIIAITSRTKKGISKIAPTLKLGAGVVSTRANVHYIVTEYGAAYLYGKTLKQRAVELTKIAHPDDREMLEKATFERFGSQLY